MFMIELLSGGGVYMVYATDTANKTFLIYNSGHWEWIGLNRCRPYTYPLGGISFGGGAAT